MSGNAYGSLRMAGTSGGPYYSGVTYNYTASTWNTGQTVYVTGWEDNNFANETVTITHSVLDGQSVTEYRPAEDVALTVNVTDNDAGLTLTPQAVTVQAGGSGGSYTVALAASPTGPVTATSPSAAVALDTDGTPQTRTLTFSTTSWNTAQAVTVSPTNDADDVDGVDETVTIQHTAAAGSGDQLFSFVALPINAVTVTIDDDETPGVTLSAMAVTVNEDPAVGGGTTAHEGTYTVVLDAGLKAGESVAVEVSSGDANAAQVVSAGGTLGSTAQVTFTPSTWNTAQTDADGRDEAVTLSHRIATASVSSDYPATLTVAPVTVNVDDKDTPGLVVDPQTLAVTEPPPATNAAAPYTLRLATLPGGPVTVTATSDNTAVTVDADSTPQTVALTFSTTSWNTAQTVTVRTDGDADAQADAAALTHRAAGGDYTGAAPAVTVTVNVTDDDAGVVISRRAVTVQGGARNTYTVRLAAQPAGSVTVTVTATSPDADVGVGSAGSPGSRTLVFTATTWNTPQAVTVTGGTVMSDKKVTVTHTVSGYGPVTTAADVRVTVLSATGALRVDPLALALLEDGPAGTYTVQTRAQPTDPVTVTVVVNNPTNALITAMPTVLTFDATMWAAQAVTVTAAAVTVTAAADTNTATGSATLNHTVTTVGFTAQA